MLLIGDNVTHTSRFNSDLKNSVTQNMLIWNQTHFLFKKRSIQIFTVHAASGHGKHVHAASGHDKPVHAAFRHDKPVHAGSGHDKSVHAASGHDKPVHAASG